MVRAPDFEPIGPVTFEEFLEFEQESELKHELVDGFIYPWGDANPVYGLAGASRRHVEIAENIAYALRPAARARGCRIYGSDLLLRLTNRIAYYPDVQVTCDASDNHEIYNRRPCVVFEVLSRRTSRRDRTEKVVAYRTIDSLQAYVIVHQHQRLVECHFRDGSGEWQLETITAGSVSIPCVDVDLPLDTVYDGILDD
jgi:Uma2 family endonuclease